MPPIITLSLAKFSLVASRWSGRGGSALPGLIADTISPNLANKLSHHLGKVILITGTNGKTTTTKMLVEILRADGRQVITNSSGSNLMRGITTKLIEEASITGRLRAEVGVFEVDEASLPAVADALKPDQIVILNLFRDQLDRYGELDSTAGLLSRVLARHKRAEVLLNADDPLVASLARPLAKHRVQFFGVESSDIVKLDQDATADSDHSPLDGTPLIYTKNWFGHLGHYKSKKGDFVRPDVHYALKQQGDQLQIKLGHDAARLELPLPGLYNAYNALTAAAIAAKMAVKIDVITATLARTRAAFGRVEKFAYQDRQVYLLLIKNPTGFNQVIQTFLKNHKNNSRTMIAINDNFADGRDVSWLWDAALEEISGAEPVMCSGKRAYDLALRLKYAERRSEVTENLEEAFKRVIKQTPTGGTVYVLPTYTAMMDLRRWLTTQVELEAFHG